MSDTLILMVMSGLGARGFFAARARARAAAEGDRRNLRAFPNDYGVYAALSAVVSAALGLSMSDVRPVAEGLDPKADVFIGMVGCVARAYPDGLVTGFFDPNLALPAQIYSWVASYDEAFFEKAWGGIIVLLIFLLTMNITAIILRRTSARRW